MDNLTVLVVHNRYKIRGGEDSVFENEVKLLKESGCNVITYERDNSEIDKFNFVKKLLLPFTSVFSFKTYREIKEIIKKNSVDIVHVHNTLSLISPSVFYAAKKCKIPVFATLHNFRLICSGAMLYRNGEICEECLKKGLFRSVKHRCYRGSKLQSFILSLTTKIHRQTGIYRYVRFIALTEFNKNKLISGDKKHKMFTEENIFVKPNTVDRGASEIIPAENRSNSFVFAGRLEKTKGVDFLVANWKDIPEYHLDIYGGGALFEFCDSYIKDNGITNITLHGPVDNLTAVDAVRHARGLVLPTTWYEGFPVSILEAISAGTPVVVPSLGNAGDIVKEGVCGYHYAPCDGADFAEAIRKTAEDFSLITSSAVHFAENYTKEKNTEALLALYRAAIAEGKDKK